MVLLDSQVLRGDSDVGDHMGVLQEGLDNVSEERRVWVCLLDLLSPRQTEDLFVLILFQ